MASSDESQQIQLHQLSELHHLEEFDCNYVFDYGGSLIKLLFKAEHEILVRYNVQIQHKGKPFVAFFAHDEREALFRFLKDNGLTRPSDKVIHSTGIGVKLYNTEISQTLNVQLRLHEEMDCYVKALSYLLKCQTFDELFWPLERSGFEIAVRITDGFLNMSKRVKEECLLESSWSSDSGKFSLQNTVSMNWNERYDSYYDKTAPQFPCLVAICGSGNLIVKMQSETAKAELVEYSARGGRTILGLGSLLTGAKNFEELVGLATKGNSLNLDTHLKDIKGGDADDWYGLFPDDGLSFCFGKANKKSLGDFSREDLAAAVFSMVLDDLAQTCLALAIANHQPSIIFCGSLLNHEVARHFLTKHFLAKSMTMAKDKQPSLKMCRLGSHLGAIGTWMSTMEMK